jgi:hypothetical protein
MRDSIPAPMKTLRKTSAISPFVNKTTALSAASIAALTIPM